MFAWISSAWTILTVIFKYLPTVIEWVKYLAKEIGDLQDALAKKEKAKEIQAAVKEARTSKDTSKLENVFGIAKAQPEAFDAEIRVVPEPEPQGLLLKSFLSEPEDLGGVEMAPEPEPASQDHPPLASATEEIPVQPDEKKKELNGPGFGREDVLLLIKDLPEGSPLRAKILRDYGRHGGNN